MMAHLPQRLFSFLFLSALAIPASAQRRAVMEGLAASNNAIYISTVTGSVYVRTAGTATVGGNAFSVGASTLVVSSGRLGIGLTAPLSKLHIEGAADAPSLSAQTGLLFLGGVGVTGLEIGINSSGDFGTYLQSTNYPVSGGGAYPLSLNYLGGNVGIGTLSPAHTLHTVGSAYVSGQQIVGGTMTVQGGSFSVGTSTFVVSGGSVTIGVNAFFVSSAGNVAVANVSPISKFDANGTITQSLATGNITNYGHFIVDGTVANTPTAGCGNTAAISTVGNDSAGRITTQGTGLTNSCGITFGRTFTNVPVCMCSSDSATSCAPAPTATNIIFYKVGGAAWLDTEIIAWFCIGQQ